MLPPIMCDFVLVSKVSFLITDWFNIAQFYRHDKAIQTSKKAIGVLYQVFESLLTSSKGIIK